MPELWARRDEAKGPSQHTWSPEEADTERLGVELWHGVTQPPCDGDKDAMTIFAGWGSQNTCHKYNRSWWIERLILKDTVTASIVKSNCDMLRYTLRWYPRWLADDCYRWFVPISQEILQDLALNPRTDEREEMLEMVMPASKMHQKAAMRMVVLRIWRQFSTTDGYPA